MKHMRAHLLSLLRAAALLAALLAGCGGQSAQTPAAEPEAPMSEGAEPEVDLGALLDEAVPLGDAPAMSTVLKTSAPGTAVKENSSTVIDYSNAKDGYVMVKWLSGSGPRIKVLVKGPSGVTYQYNLRQDGQYDAFPLSDGNGGYTVGVYKNTSGTKYSTVLTASLTATLADEFAPFVRPNQYVNFTEGSAAVKKAAELCKGVTDNLAKVEKIYSYVVNHVVYDYDKAATVQSGYLPNVDDTLATGKGICFDYAALMSAMLRSQGVPVKLVVGYTGDVYHAWISVYSEKDGWIEGKIYFDGKVWKLMDPTFASGGKNSTEILNYIGNGANYSAKYLY